MCGIAGYTTLISDKMADPNRINPMLNRIKHRGPDATGSAVFDKVVFGNTRLSIIDLAGGDQPISNEDGSVTVVYNGEIYNFPELRLELESKGHIFRTHTDTEILVHLYEEEGEDFVKRLNGMFAFALFDHRHQLLLIACDRFGVKPLFYYQADDEIYFASEIKALRDLPGFDSTLSPEGIAVSMGLMFITAPWTIYKHVKRLRQGHFLRITQEGMHEICYADWNLETKIQINHTEAAEETARLLTASVERQMLSDVPVGVLLSGGLDSRTIHYLASKVRDDLAAFTICFDEGEFDESGAATEWARTLGTSHYRMLFTEEQFCDNYLERQLHLDEPYALWCNVASASLASFIREKGYKVVLGGDGGDELFLGYPTVQAAVLAKVYHLIPKMIRSRLISPAISRLPAGNSRLPFAFMAKSFVQSDNTDLFRMFFGFKEVLRYKEWPSLLTKEALAMVSGIDPFIAHSQYLDKTEGLNLVDALSYMDYKVFMPGASLYGADNAYMASSVELRVPFLDNELASFAASLPTDVRFSMWSGKPILKDALKNRILSRSEFGAKAALKGYRKAGFEVPGPEWIQKPRFQSLIKSVLSRKRIERTGFFRPDAVEKLFHDQLAGRENNERALQVICSLILFLDR